MARSFKTIAKQQVLIYGIIAAGAILLWNSVSFEEGPLGSAEVTLNLDDARRAAIAACDEQVTVTSHREALQYAASIQAGDASLSAEERAVDGAKRPIADGVAYLDLDAAYSDAESVYVVTASQVTKTGNLTRRQPSQIYIVTPRGCVARLYDKGLSEAGFMTIPPAAKMQMHAADVLQRSP